MLAQTTRLLASNFLLAVDDSLANPDVAWQLQTRWDWAPWLTCLMLAAMVLLVVVCYRSEISPAQRGYRILLGVLRLTTIGLLLIMLSEAVFSGVRSGRPRLAILVDRSESMQIEDASVPAETSPAKETSEASQLISRETAARKVLLREEGQLLNQLAEQYDLELMFVDTTLTDGGKQTEELIKNLQIPSSSEQKPNANRSATRLGDALTTLIESPVGSPLQGIVALTDGQTTQGRSLTSASESARRNGIPLYFVGIGNETKPPQAELEGLLADDRAFVDDLVNFQATLRSTGMAGRDVEVELLRNGKVVSRKELSFPGDSEDVAPSDNASGEAEISLPIQMIDRPPSEGQFQYTLRATPRSTDNGREVEASELSHLLTVREGRLKVLLAAAYPNYEYRYLKHLLERDSTVEIATILQEADPEHSESDLTALRRFPVRAEELKPYDVLILMDLDPTLLPRSLWGNLSNFVSQRGGGLALVAGPKHLPSAYLNRPELMAMLPTKPSAGVVGGWNDKTGYRPRLTKQGELSSPLLLADTPEKSAQVWANLAPFYWLADVGVPKPSAQVLAEHPTYMATAGKGAPLIVTQYFGAGKVLLHAVDDTWRWRYKVGDVYFARYWIQMLRSLARGKRDDIGERIELTMNDRQFELGESVRIELRDDRSLATGSSPPKLRLTTPGQAEEQIELAPNSSSKGRFTARLSGLAAGKYRAVLVDDNIEGIPRSVEFEILAPPGELAHTEMNRLGLMQAAERTRGEFIPLSESADLLERLPTGRSVPIDTLPPYELWNRWPLLLAITICLSLEWILRKRKSML